MAPLEVLRFESGFRNQFRCFIFHPIFRFGPLFHFSPNQRPLFHFSPNRSFSRPLFHFSPKIWWWQRDLNLWPPNLIHDKLDHRTTVSFMYWHFRKSIQTNERPYRTKLTADNNSHVNWLSVPATNFNTNLWYGFKVECPTISPKDWLFKN